jgi:PAS domain S-box-containing protein
MKIITANSFVPGSREPAVDECESIAQAELGRREFVRWLATAMEDVTDVLWMAEADLSRFEYVSASYEAVWGRSCQSLYAAPDLFLCAVHPEDRRRVLQHLAQRKAGRSFLCEYRIVQPDGTVRRIRDRGFAVRRKSSGEVTHLAGVARDITGWKKPGGAVRAGDVVAWTSGEAAIATTLEGVITAWNPAAEWLFGFSANEVVGRSVMMVVPPALAEEESSALRRISRGEAVRRITQRRHRDGTLLELEVRVCPVRDRNGCVVGARSQFHATISHPQPAGACGLLLQALRASEDLVFVTDAENRFVFANRAFLDAYGYTVPELAGRTPVMLGAAASELGEILGAARAGGWRGELVNRRKNGSEFVVTLNAFAITADDGSVIAYVGMARDVTAQRRLAAAARKAAQRFRVTFEQSAVGMAHATPEGRFLRVNDKLCEITGFSREELLRTTFEQLTHPDDRTLEREHQRRLLAGSVTAYALEKRCRQKAGAVRWVNVTVSLVREDSDYVVIVVEDITARRNVEEQLRQAHKMEAIGQLAGGVAHDFNNILAFVGMRATLTAMAEELPPQVVADLQQITAATDRGARLTRQLLMYSRQEAMQPRHVDLNELIAGTTKMLRRIVGEDIDLIVATHEQPLTINADAGMMDQVLMNLVVNARDAMPRGGTLRIETAPAHVTPAEAEQIAGAAPGEHIRLRVSDTGVGISPENLKRIFEPFFTTKPANRGTGLGLAMVFGIVKQHRGWIHVATEEGRGTTFDVFLPVTGTEAAVCVPPEPSEGAVVGGGEAILVVEDEEPVRTAIRLMLERRGYAVLEAADGVEAVRVWEAQDRRIALLLTDLVMPAGMNGGQLADRLQAEDPGLKVLFTTGYADDVIHTKVALGADRQVLQKPFKPFRLLSAVRQILDGQPRAT